MNNNRLHHKHLALRVVAQWKHFAHSSIMNIRAQNHYKHSLLLQSWKAWRTYHVTVKRGQRGELVALIQFKFALQRRCWMAWRKKIERARKDDAFEMFVLHQGTYLLLEFVIMFCSCPAFSKVSISCLD